jgi:hypothetical protein
MKSGTNFLDTSILNFFSDLPSRKEKVEIGLHPEDNRQAREAAAKQGMEFDEFCAIAIHMAVRDGRKLR